MTKFIRVEVVETSMRDEHTEIINVDSIVSIAETPTANGDVCVITLKDDNKAVTVDQDTLWVYGSIEDFAIMLDRAGVLIESEEDEG